MNKHRDKTRLALVAALVVVAAWGITPRTLTQQNQVLANAFPAGLLVSPASCTTPAWPHEARRYEVDGMTQLHFRIRADGSIGDARVVKSSSWQLLDDAALQSLVKCRFKAGLDKVQLDATYPVRFVWTLSDPAAVRPQLVPDSCAASARFSRFEAFNRQATDGDGVLVRFLVGEDGAPLGIKAETGGTQADAVRAAMQFIGTCRFASDPAMTGDRTDTLYGRVLFRRQ